MMEIHPRNRKMFALIACSILCYVRRQAMFAVNEMLPLEATWIASFRGRQKRRALSSPKGRSLGIKRKWHSLAVEIAVFFISWDGLIQSQVMALSHLFVAVLWFSLIVLNSHNQCCQRRRTHSPRRPGKAFPAIDVRNNPQAGRFHESSAFWRFRHPPKRTTTFPCDHQCLCSLCCRRLVL